MKALYLYLAFRVIFTTYIIKISKRICVMKRIISIFLLVVIALCVLCTGTAALRANSEVELYLTDSTVAFEHVLDAEIVDEEAYSEYSGSVRVNFDAPIKSGKEVTVQNCTVVLSLMADYGTHENKYLNPPHKYVCSKTAGEGETEVNFSYADDVEFAKGVRCGGTAAPSGFWIIEADGDHLALPIKIGGGGVNFN